MPSQRIGTLYFVVRSQTQFSQLARRSCIPAFSKFCAVLHDVLATCVRSSDQTTTAKHYSNPSRCYKFLSIKIGKYKRIQRDKFPFVSRGNEDWKRRRRERQRKLVKDGRHCSFDSFVVLLLRTFWPCSTFYRSYFCCLRHVFGKERL